MHEIISYNNKILSYGNKLLRPISSDSSVIRFSFNNCTHIPTDYTDWCSYDPSTGYNPWVYLGNNIWDYYPIYRHDANIGQAPWINDWEFHSNNNPNIPVGRNYGLLTRERFGSTAEIHILSYKCKAAINSHTRIFFLNNAIYSASNISFLFNENYPNQGIDATLFFGSCPNLRNTANIDLTNVKDITGFFMGGPGSSLIEIPNWDTSSIENAADLFYGQISLTEIPLFDTSSMTNVVNMFRYCANVTHGALALYTQMSTQANPPVNYERCFQDCGLYTPTGRAELEQIPASWGGLGA